MVNETDARLLDWVLEALYVHDRSGRITHINEPDGDRAPQLALVRNASETRWRFRDDVADEIIGRLEPLLRAEPAEPDLRQSPRHLVTYLKAHSAGRAPEVHAGPEHLFPETIPAFGDVTPITRDNLDLLARIGWNLEQLNLDFEARAPYLAVIQDGAAVSVCFSSRLTEHVAEAGVETAPAFRGRGYAPRVAAAWAEAVRASGRFPIYGTSWDNLASQVVARKLGLVQFATSLSIE